MPGWGNLLGKVADQFQGRIERLKNEKGRLLDERNKIMSGEKLSIDGARRVVAIDARLSEINGILANKASD